MTYNSSIPQNISYIGAKIGQCGNVDGCQDAPEFLVNHIPALSNKFAKFVNAQNIDTQEKALPHLIDFSIKLKATVQKTLADDKFPIIIGGDHSCAIGTWSSMIETASSNGNFGLIWIDAHLDLHTLKTSPSKNLHGIPVAALLDHLGNSFSSIINSKNSIKPENIFFIGVRSFEKEELELAKKLGMKVYFVEEVHQKGFEACFKEAVSSFQQKNIPYGISLDLDAIDSRQVSAVGTPVDNGIQKESLISALKSENLRGIKAVELVEYNPRLDRDNQSLDLVQEILSCLDKEIKL